MGPRRALGGVLHKLARVIYNADAHAHKQKGIDATHITAYGGHQRQHSDHLHGHYDHHDHAQIFSLGPSEEVDTVAICSWIIILVLFVGAFERFLHHLDHR